MVSETGLRLGICSSIRRFHYLDTTGGISMGSNTIIAGRGSVLFTHGLSPVNLDFQKGIVIGDWVYIGAKVNILPGAQIAKGVFVGMGSTVVGILSDEYSVYASAKAVKIKSFDGNSAYYDRPYIMHKHLKKCMILGISAIRNKSGGAIIHLKGILEFSPITRFEEIDSYFIYESKSNR